MPVINCPSCGAITNTAICPGWWSKKTPAKCVAKIENQQYVQGCGYSEASPLNRQYADTLIAENPGWNTPPPESSSS